MARKAVTCGTLVNTLRRYYDMEPKQDGSRTLKILFGVLMANPSKNESNGETNLKYAQPTEPSILVISSTKQLTHLLQYEVDMDTIYMAVVFGSVDRSLSDTSSSVSAHKE